ncbi:MAG: tRNA (guanosine(37)-N1)-methyltransferase TrmD [Candidatus Paceibacterota bacterium]|jgi:tRNA (guanine37-N1)-methyltransferase|nr:tRNA (guanosine(37)-N1)-methyltransferase TrmD [Candidatus Paceibacterota bacterium]MDD4999252.1 tRNA (guanosine(37)-N1)-methyltransferase TrmD [Candidatus Paceibacterota bacterium]MDD5545390.1 tRNA (guanosine(37)-N1)-methyltransferase TrmD [Candidatus Paceibacterota bacterium]
MTFDVVTIFPEAFESYFNVSIIKRAKAKGLIKINIHNLRSWTNNRRQTVDDSPYGGGAGMVFKVEPIFRALKDLLKKKIKTKKNKKAKRRVILFSPGGKKLNQEIALRLSRYDQLVLICPRYEGIDERVKDHLIDEEISVGDYVLSGAELPAMVLVDAVSRLIPGVIKKQSLKEESFSLTDRQNIKNLLCCEYPQYTRPAVFYPNSKNKKIAWKVPEALLKGDHKKIKEWREKHMKIIS